MPNIKTCERCGKLHNSTYFNLCAMCFEQDEEDFMKIKEFLYEHPCAKVYEVVNALGMPVKKIKRYLRENRLEIIEKDNRFLFCEMCGKPIRSGKYCDNCYHEFYQDYKVIYIKNNSRYPSTINYNSKSAL